MRATEELREEHEGIRIMLRVLDRFAMGVEAGNPVQAEDGDSILDFLRVFVDRCHHAKEEEILFPLLSGTEGSIAETLEALVQEHREGRALVHAMEDSLKRYRNGEPAAKGIFAQSARSYVDILDSHTRVENDVVLPLAERLLDEEPAERMSEAFQRIERDRIGEGMHENFHRLLAMLEEKYVAPVEDASPATHATVAAPLRQGEWHEDV